MRLLQVLPFLFLPAPLAAEGADLFAYDPTVVEVDVELALMVDVSRSMTSRELEIQRRGYAEALTSDAVLSVIGDGFLGRIALTYVEWAGPGSHRVVVDWTTIGSAEEAARVAGALMANQPYGMQRTSISSALDYAADTIEGNGYQGLRRVVDVSGDGPNNSGAPVVPARDRLLQRGIIINGLPLMTDEGVGSQWSMDTLDAYYRDCVIGGQGAFVIPVRSWDEFADAVRRKIVLEIAAIQPRIMRAGSIDATPATGVAPQSDCLAGEKTWERFRQQWEP
ncbi:Protein of unknown function [Pseudooceanicola antarcticus]|uniref:DUF1194 domain-containing protein n=1 Tax=Pseudooceanicola antarcticus TaxID=1247613 RepID=A0A285J1L3_9RHOB|nr:DUF1194 domain-containing protein [Pseudooceanicola antarcticus]PJE29824.1 DUF1194 domain-containing protein [Pseudooceanicola antarcticus]SNY54205.1 Protein of unknown function [Pseudooceanicola antarcticus]